MLLLPPLLIPALSALLMIIFKAHEAGYGGLALSAFGRLVDLKIYAIIPPPAPCILPNPFFTATEYSPSPTAAPHSPIDDYTNSNADSEDEAPPDTSESSFDSFKSLFAFWSEFLEYAFVIFTNLDNFWKTNPGDLEILLAHEADMKELERKMQKTLTRAGNAHQANRKQQQRELQNTIASNVVLVTSLGHEIQGLKNNTRQQVEQIADLWGLLAQRTTLPASPPPSPPPFSPPPPPPPMTPLLPLQHNLPPRPPSSQPNLPARPPPPIQPLRPTAAAYNPSHNIDVLQRQSQQMQQRQPPLQAPIQLPQRPPQQAPFQGQSHLHPQQQPQFQGNQPQQHHTRYPGQNQRWPNQPNQWSQRRI